MDKLGARESRFREPSILFALPLIGAYLVIGAVDLFVPRDHRAMTILAAINSSNPNFGADAISALYYMALGYVLNVIACALCIGWCLWFIHRHYGELTSAEAPRFQLGLALAFGIPMLILGIHIWYPGCGVLAIDDCITSTLFMYSIRKVYLAHFAFTIDADVFACLVFISYLVSASTVTLIVSTRPTALPSSGQAQAPGKMTTDDRTRALNTLLFLIALVLITSTLASRLRFDVGLATLGAPPTPTAPNLAFSAYQAVSSAIMTYWATVLSICLAFIYLPGALLLLFRATLSGPIVLSDFFKPNQENFIRLMKLVAIFSPPLINKVIELISAVPKGV